MRRLDAEELEWVAEETAWVTIETRGWIASPMLLMWLTKFVKELELDRQMSTRADAG